MWAEGIMWGLFIFGLEAEVLRSSVLLAGETVLVTAPTILIVGFRSLSTRIDRNIGVIYRYGVSAIATFIHNGY
ncbi:MAG TPA: hypothetical protein VK436_01610 [Methanocella sp.]|nr:hypothetical protein [Methanocella sp.]